MNRKEIRKLFNSAEEPEQFLEMLRGVMDSIDDICQYDEDGELEEVERAMIKVVHEFKKVKNI